MALAALVAMAGCSPASSNEFDASPDSAAPASVDASLTTQPDAANSAHDAAGLSPDAERLSIDPGQESLDAGVEEGVVKAARCRVRYPLLKT